MGSGAPPEASKASEPAPIGGPALFGGSLYIDNVVVVISSAPVGWLESTASYPVPPMRNPSVGNAVFAVTATAVILGAIVASLPRARAEVRVAGGRRSLSVDADHASIEEVLATLNSAVGLKYRSSVKLDRPFSGHVDGSLDEIIAHLLFPRDYSYVYSDSAEGPKLEIIAAGLDTAGASAAELPALEPSAWSGPFEPRRSSEGRARFWGQGGRSSKAFDATQAMMWDKTLRYGDVIVTDEGLRVFEGNAVWPHPLSDFRTLAETRDLTAGARAVLTEIEQAMKTRIHGHGDRPIVATDPPSPRGR